MTVVGVDVSSRAVHLAWLENGRPCRWHQELGSGHLIDRLRRISIHWPEDVVEIAVEYPYARQHKAIAALMATVGVVTRQAPPWARVAWPSAGELRAAIGARNTKESAHRHIVHDYGWMPVLAAWDEHELDALTACIGWTRILQAQDAA